LVRRLERVSVLIETGLGQTLATSRQDRRGVTVDRLASTAETFRGHQVLRDAVTFLRTEPKDR
jgi:hypothetical protein